MRPHRLLIVEEALRDREGHWFEYNRATKAALQSTGDVHVDMLGHQTMELDVASELEAMPHFQFTVWDQIYNQPQALRRYFGIGQHNYRLYRDLSAYLKQADYYDTVFAPTVVLHHLAGYHALAKRYTGKRFGQLVLLVRNNIALYDSEGSRTFRSTAKFWKWAICRFSPMLEDGSVRLVTDSERLADEYEELTGIRFEVLPHPSLVGGSNDETMPHVAGADGTQALRVFLPGPARYEKGVVRLLEAVQMLATQELSSPLDILLQWRTAFKLPDGSTIGPDDVAGYGSDQIRFHVFREALSSAEYLAELNSADLIVLPYLREAYFARISGVAVEAMMLGKPMVYTSDTWVAALAESFRVGIASGGSSEELRDALLDATVHIEKLTANSKGRAEEVKQYFSAEKFASVLLADRGEKSDG
ncbi:glycosyltransferase family protein [Allorhodopirellula solitaria]|uniref:Glycosyl transferases group 1 n=1 Tax=Allorhodopirellula solitaria TaxID=2527987 RepID=A0A5C5YDR0_9BACT|nr:glycosyltransferase [Allorhodopirellula solitaria]TWT72943.1 hypothetical protein CA85_14040 [Allorhodopirellula solitaria]